LQGKRKKTSETQSKNYPKYGKNHQNTAKAAAELLVLEVVVQTCEGRLICKKAGR
jgi:hypothetical protein